MKMRNTLHSILKQLRDKSGKTQKQVADELKISDRTYGHYETGKREPSIDVLMDIADYYNISLDLLTGRYEVKKNIQKTEQPFRVQVARTYDGTSHRRTVTDEEMQKINELPDATDF